MAAHDPIAARASAWLDRQRVVDVEAVAALLENERRLTLLMINQDGNTFIKPPALWPLWDAVAAAAPLAAMATVLNESAMLVSWLDGFRMLPAQEVPDGGA